MEVNFDLNLDSLIIKIYPTTNSKSSFTDKIAREADVFDCFVCEVGSGPGSLTRSVLRAGARHVAAVEIDRRFIPALEVMCKSNTCTSLYIHRMFT